MLQSRIIPCLQLINESLVKTVKFNNHKYIGDPVNTVRIFNELEVDELCFLDIRASKEKRLPPIEILKQIAGEAFMPMAYGGGINSFELAQNILAIGFEKVILNTASFQNPILLTQISNHFGSQAVVVSIDVKKNIWGKYQVFINDGTENTKEDPIVWAKKAIEAGAGEILLTSIDREGTWEGLDLKLIKQITDSVNVPVIANGGAGSIQHIQDAVSISNASAVALGSMVVFQKKDMGVLINTPDFKF